MILPPKQAIQEECRFCMNTKTFRGCNSTTCKLNDASLTNLKKIKAHCATCVADQNRRGVRDCDGLICNPEMHKCPLHPYRLGKNPTRAGIGNKNPNSRPVIEGKTAINKPRHIKGLGVKVAA